ncbi:MAG: type V CRISPR-associated protein Cas12b [Phycisphaeraceae bacterium]|nr:type V CRISPR-associated protein Cas12b [Phycisphaeraceae bacterium]
MAHESGPVATPRETPSHSTQRAYTLRLRGADSRDNAWRKALWATHEAVNRGARAFGEWLLTLRGGLRHDLAELPPSSEKSLHDDGTAALRKNRRILLALSWLSVEDARGAPEGATRVASGQDTDSIRRDKVLAAFRSILVGHRIDTRSIDSWVEDCADSLSASIRDDAVWVNRSALFDAKAAEFKGLTRAYATEIVLSFFGPADDYFSLPDTGPDDGVTLAAGDDDSKFKQKARQWISTNFGTGLKSDTDHIVTSLRRLAKAELVGFANRPKAELIEAMSGKVNGPTSDLDGLRVGIGWTTGRPSKGRLAVEKLPDRPTKAEIEAVQQKFAEEADDKEAKSGTRDVPGWMSAFRSSLEAAVGMPFVDHRNHIGEFSVMLDHAARRVAIGHSWIKRAEAERRRFEADAQRLGTVPANAAVWLDAYVQERGGSAGGEYRIRRRAVEGWDEVLKRWKRPPCASAVDRVAAAREVQADPEIEKFGDIQLFEALASDDALCVWQNDNKVAPDRLKDYVFAHDARFKQRRFKVPAYRHPDALRHPVFGDFGNSRWKVEYSALEAAKAARGGRRISAQDERRLGNPRIVRLGLWTGDVMSDVDLRWSCKRLSADLALGQAAPSGQIRSVSRADRLGRAASGIRPGEVPSPAGLLSQAEWNARLQAPRSQLDDLAIYLDRNGGRWDDKAKRMRDRLAWLVTFSAKLECRGSFIDYAAQNGINANRKGEYYPNADRNKADRREGHAKLILSRLPGLRVLSVDLGHRFAGACAVWETLSQAELVREVAGRSVIDGGADATDLYLHTRHTDRAGNERTTIYRRIGCDKLPNGSEHPAPWARLDRQFLIKLQGEESSARKASPDEFNAVRRMESELGYAREDRNQLPMRIDDLLSDAVRLARLALRRHGDAARIAYAFKPGSARLTPGGGAEEHTAETRTRAILDALMLWHGLATSDRWDDREAKQAWQAHIRPMLEADLPSIAPDADAGERKRHRAAAEQALAPVAVSLTQRGTDGMFAVWAERWTVDDAAWRPRLRQLRRLLLPRGLRPVDGETGAQAAARKARRGAARNVGGLSLARIATIRDLYQVQKAYAMRPEPGGLRKNIAERNDDRFAGFGRSVLETVERLREQRVKQIASRIVEAALGVGRARMTHGRDRKRPQAPVDAICHAVVIESLRNYRPDELQTRRENRALMNWSAGRVRKYLEEACQLHGLHLREVMPNYTSRQCSRTGLPGLRCDDVPIDEFLTAPWWNRAVNGAVRRLRENGADSLDHLLVALREKWIGASDLDTSSQRTLRLPRAGGDLFVTAPSNVAATNSRHRSALQADLNAAANIGLRALLDPDFPGRWWYIPCIEDKVTGTAVPRADKVKGSVCFGPDSSKPEQFGSLLTPSARDSSDGQARSTRRQRLRGSTADGNKETTNFWSDPRGNALRNAASGGFWLPTPAYWRWVRKRVVAALWLANGLPAPSADLVPEREG